MIAYFGQDFSLPVYALSSSAERPQDMLATPVTVYVYDGKPTRLAAATGASGPGYALLQTITSWDPTPDGLGKLIDIAAIAQPSDVLLTKKYYVAINAQIQAGQVLPPFIREATLSTLRVQESAIDVRVEDLMTVDPSLNELCNCVGDLEDYIHSAAKEVRNRLMASGAVYADLYDPSQLNDAVAKLAVSMYYMGVFRQVDDRYFVKGQEYAGKYSQALRSVYLLLDLDADGTPETKFRKRNKVHSLRILR